MLDSSPRRSVFAGGRSPNDPDLNTKEFVLVGVARDLIKTHGWLLAFDEVQLVDIAGAGMLNRCASPRLLESFNDRLKYQKKNHTESSLGTGDSEAL